MESKISKDEIPTPSITKAASLSSTASKHKFNKTSISYFHADAQLMYEFENSGKSFNYSKTLVSLSESEVRSQKLVVRAVSKLKSLRGGSIRILCDAVVKEVQKLTGYDRVMVYKFHEDDHGEIVSEFKRTDLEPYLGLHYLATDIPQVARVLFKQNRIRMICDCNSEPVRIVQSPEIVKPLSLISSTLRAPHACHVEYMLNMGSIASLVLAIVVADDGVGSSTRLWGLVVCHHTESRHIPFPLRSACELVMQAFNLQLQGELQLASQLAEKQIL